MITYTKFRQGITADEMRKVSLQEVAPVSPLSRAIHDEIPASELRYVPDFPSLPEGIEVESTYTVGEKPWSEQPPEGCVASFSDVPVQWRGTYSTKLKRLVFPWMTGKIVNRSAAIEPLMKEICDE